MAKKRAAKAPATTDGIVTSEAVYKTSRLEVVKQRLAANKIYTAIGAGLVVVILLAGFLLFHNPQSELVDYGFTPADDSSIPVNDYGSMSPDEVGYRLQQLTHMSFRDLKAGKFSGTSFTDFKTTLSVGRGLASVNSMNAALKAYAIAESKGGKDKGDFYVEYSGVALEAEDTTLAKQCFDKANNLLAKMQPSSADYLTLKEKLDAIKPTIEEAQ